MSASEADLFGVGGGDDDLDEATARDVAEVERALRGEGSPRDTVEVDLEADDPAVPGNETEAQALTRRDKRAARGQLREENERLRKEQQADRERIARLELIAEQAQRGMFQQPGAPQQDPIADAIKKTYDDERQLREHADAVFRRHVAEGKAVPDDVRKDFDRRGQELEMRRGELVAVKTMRDHGVKPVDPNEIVRAQVQAEHADVYGNQKAAVYARAAFDLAVAKGEKPDRQLLDRVMDQTRAEFGMEQRPMRGVTAARRAKLTGVGRGVSGGPERPDVVRLDRDTQRIAEGFFAHEKGWSPEKKHREWAKMMTKDARDAR